MAHDSDRTSPRRLPVVALLSANAVSMTGNAVANVAIPWFVLETTGSAARVGLTAAAIALSNVLAAFFGGPMVDRLGYKRLSVLSDVLSGVTVAMVPLLYATVGLAFWQLLLLVFLGGVLDTPGVTARQSMLPGLAEGAGMPKERANSAFFGVSQVSDFVGLLAGGILVALIGAAGVLWINAATFAVSAVAVALGVPALRPRDRTLGDRFGARGYLADLREGLEFIFRERLVRAMCLAAVAFNLLAVPLLAVVVPVYADRNFGDASSLGFMLGAFAGGTLLSNTAFGAFGYRLPRRAVFASAVAARWLPIWALVFSPSLPLSVAALAVAGLANGPIDPLIFTAIQERTPGRLLARVNGASLALARGAAPVGAALAGWTLGAFGLGPVLAAVAAGLLVVSLTLVSAPALREMDGREKA